jgi:hypothetical protein
MNTNRSKTQKRVAADDLSGNVFAANLRASTNVFVNFLNQEADDAYKRPWHKLEKGLRMNRLKKFVDDETSRLNLSEHSKAALLLTLMKAFEKKNLNSKSAVIYDLDEQCIKEIKGLVMHRNAEGEVLFQLLEKRNAVTFRKKAATVAPAPQSESQPPKH